MFENMIRPPKSFEDALIKMAENEEKQALNARVQSIITRLHNASVGRYQWQVRDIDSHALYIWFEEWEHGEANHWFELHGHQHNNSELARVHVRDSLEKLMRDAGKLIAELSAKLSD